MLAGLKKSPKTIKCDSWIDFSGSSVPSTPLRETVSDSQSKTMVWLSLWPLGHKQHCLLCGHPDSEPAVIDSTSFVSISVDIFKSGRLFKEWPKIRLFCVFTLSLYHIFLFKPVQAHLLRADRNNNNHWQEQIAELRFRSCWPWQKVRSVQLIFRMFKSSLRTPCAVGLCLTVLSTGAKRRYAAVFFMSWASGYTWSCTHSQLPHFLWKKLLLFYHLGLRRSLPTSNNFLKRSPSSNRYCAPVEIWN